MKRVKITVMSAFLLLSLSSYAMSQSNTAAASGSSPSVPDFGMGLMFGSMTINGSNYNAIRLQPEFALGEFGVGLDLNLEFDAQWKVRTTEWSSWQAILSKILYLRWGTKGEPKPVYVKIGSIDDFTLGHGTIMNLFSNMLDYPNLKKVGIALDLDFGIAGFESMVDNIFDFDILGGRIYARPLSMLSIPIVSGIEVGATFVIDLDPKNPLPSLTTPYNFIDATNSVAVGVYGFDLGTTVLDTPIATLAAYFDFVGISGKGTGEIFGFGGSIFKFVPYKLEVRILQPKFTASYFDINYDATRNSVASKYDSLDSITNGYAGWMFSSGVALFDNKLGFDFKVEGIFGAFSGELTKPQLTFNFYLSKELFKRFAGRFMWIKKGIDTFEDVFKFEAANSVMSADIEYYVSDNLAVMINYKRTFQVDASGNLGDLVSTTINTKLSY